MSGQPTDHQRHQSSTVPAAVFSSAFQSSQRPTAAAVAAVAAEPAVSSTHSPASRAPLTPHAPAPSASSAGIDQLPELHILASDGVEELSSGRSPSTLSPSLDSPGPTVPHFHSDPADNGSAVLAASSSSEAVPASAAAAPAAQLPRSSHIEKQTHCKVLDCQSSVDKDGYCLPHHALFMQPEAVEAETDASREKRERKERKTREAQLASLREKSQTMPSPASPPPASAAASTAAHVSHAAAPPSASSSSSSSSASSWFARQRAAGCVPLEGKDGDERAEPVVDRLLAETRRAWQQADRVVSKDLPRLAKRTSVIDDKQVCVLWGRRVGLEDVSNATKPRRSLSDHTRQEEEGEAEQEQQQAEEKSVSAAEAAPEPTPRSRVTEVEVVEERLPDISTWAAVTNVVMSVAEHLEQPPVISRLREAFARRSLSLGAHSDLEGELRDILSSQLGSQSATFAVFRACHQSILFPAVYLLKTNLYSQVGQMKDVRTQNGWTIEIFLGDGRVWITHMRTEQSLQPPDSAEHFECVWEIRLSFDRHLTDCKAVFLRIQDLSFHPAMSKERKQQIVSVLRGAGYIV